MAKIYARHIRNGTLTLEQVPARWREAAAELVVAGYAADITDGEITLQDVPEEWRSAVEAALE